MGPTEGSGAELADRDSIGRALTAVVTAVPGVRHIYPAHGRATALVAAVVAAVPVLPDDQRPPIAIDDESVTISIGVAEVESAPEVARAVSRAVAQHLQALSPETVPRVIVRVSSIG